MSRYTVQCLSGFAVEIAGLVIVGAEKLWSPLSLLGMGMSVVGLLTVLAAKKPIPDNATPVQKE